MDIGKELSLLSNEELKRFTQKSDLRGIFSLIFNWSLIIFSFSIVIYWPNPVSILSAIVILGGRILGLAILMHDCAHSSLFKSSFLNTFFGKWFCAAPILANLDGYRTYHLKHHSKAGTIEDPDRSNYINYPVSKTSFKRKVIRDLSGITGIKTLLILYKMSAGLIAYQLSYEQIDLTIKKEAFYSPLLRAFKSLFPSLVINACIFGVLFYTGHGWVYLLWPISFLTSYMLFSRVRNAAEHAVTPDNNHEDPRMNTRTTYANWLERLTVAPNSVNFHLEHHILASVPAHNLHQFHLRLKELGVLKNSDLQPGYLSVIKKLTSPTLNSSS
jgi:fatty acid desaturase